MKFLASSLLAWLKINLTRWSSLYRIETRSHSPKVLNTGDAPMLGMDIWSSVRLQPELLGAGAFFGLGSPGGMHMHSGSAKLSELSPT